MPIPKLRFKNFEEKWKSYKIEDRVGEIIGGGTPSTKVSEYWKGNIPWISSSDLEQHKLLNVIPTRFITQKAIENSSTHLIPKNSIAVVTRVGVGKLAIIDQDYCTSQDFQSLIELKDDIYFFTYLLYKELMKLSLMSQGTSIKGITKSELKNLIINIPTKEEQQNIGLFFYKLDTKIQLQKDKINLLEEQKKGYMQKIFTQELRFKDENGKDYGAWKSVKLHKLINQVKGNSLKNKETVNLPVLTISAKSGFVNQEDRFSGVIAGNSLSKYTELDKYDLSYNKGNSKTAKYGCVFVQSKYEKALVPNVYKSFRAKENVNPFYLQYLFATKILDRQLRGIISSTARMDGLLNVSDEDFFNLNILYPSINEQNKIVAFLSMLDQKIDQEERKLELLSNQKQAFMQQMFI